MRKGVFDIFIFEDDILKYGLSIEQYDECLKDISDKVTHLNDLDWSDIIEKYDLPIAKDTLRKASSQSVFGSVFVSEYLKWKGELDSSSSTKISKAKQILGNQYLLKSQLQAEKSEINKLKKDFVKSISIAEELADLQISNGFKVSVPESCCKPIINDSSYEMIAHITDWHIGYVINNCKGNSFNWTIANQRVDKLIKEIYKYIEIYGIRKIFVIATGDMIEQIYMRKNQSQYCEFNQSEQINNAIDIIFRFLTALCEKCEVEYDSVGGNHCRMNGDLSANLDGDNAETIIREQLKTYGKLSKMSRLTVINRPHTDKEIIKEVNGLLIKAKHGDNAIKDDKRQLKADISMDENFYGLLIKGHEHNFRLVSENKGRYIVSSGCLSGYNDYSTAFGCATVPSQTIIVVDQGNVELIKDVQLD